MTDAATNAEIEDVLTSIRRLVSENHISPQERDEDSAADGLLVLTPALRVLDGDKADAPATELTDAEPAESVTAEVESIDVAESDMADDAPDEEPDEQPAGDTVETPDDSTAEAESAPQGDETTPDAPDGPEANTETHSDLEQRIAELEAAVSASHDEWEPDGSEIESTPPEVFVLHAVETVPDEAPSDAETEAEEAVEAELVVDNSQPEEAAEPDMTDVEVIDAEAPERPESVDAQAVSEGEILERQRDDEDYAYIDEDALRDIVVKLIREELQGKMGEHITYNVRRMVRREIQKALTIRDLD